MKYTWFASYEYQKSGVPTKSSSIFTTTSDVPTEAYDQIKAAIFDDQVDITNFVVISFNRI